jgi:hypothetical protein
MKQRYFEDPRPSVRAVLDATSSLSAAINKSLKMGVNRGHHLTVNCRTDVFHFCSKRLYELADFDRNFFPKGWHQVHDQLGDGCAVRFVGRKFI